MNNFDHGEYFVFLACAGMIAITILRAKLVPREKTKEKGCPLYCLFSLAIIAQVIACVGYFSLACEGNSGRYNTSDQLVVISILIAGATAGFYQFSYTNAHKKERFLPNVISCIHIILFMLLFGALSWYIGINENKYGLPPESRLIFTGITFLFLLAAISFDYYDYADYSTKKRWNIRCKIRQNPSKDEQVYLKRNQ